MPAWLIYVQLVFTLIKLLFEYGLPMLKKAFEKWNETKLAIADENARRISEYGDGAMLVGTVWAQTKWVALMRPEWERKHKVKKAPTEPMLVLMDKIADFDAKHMVAKGEMTPEAFQTLVARARLRMAAKKRNRKSV